MRNGLKWLTQLQPPVTIHSAIFESSSISVNHSWLTLTWISICPVMSRWGTQVQETLLEMKCSTTPFPQVETQPLLRKVHLQWPPYQISLTVELYILFFVESAPCTIECKNCSTKFRLLLQLKRSNSLIVIQTIN